MPAGKTTKPASIPLRRSALARDKRSGDLKRRSRASALLQPPASGAHAPGAPFRSADQLRDEREIAAYLNAMLEDGDSRTIPLALRTVADALGGLSALATRTGLSRETLYRTLSDRGNPTLATFEAILGTFGLRLAIAARTPRRKTRRPRPAA